MVAKSRHHAVSDYWKIDTEPSNWPDQARERVVTAALRHVVRTVAEVAPCNRSHKHSSVSNVEDRSPAHATIDPAPNLNCWPYLPVLGDAMHLAPANEKRNDELRRLFVEVAFG